MPALCPLLPPSLALLLPLLPPLPSPPLLLLLHPRLTPHCKPLWPPCRIASVSWASRWPTSPPLSCASAICACSNWWASPTRCVPRLLLLPARCLSLSPRWLLLSLQMSRLPLPFLSSLSHAILTPSHPFH